MSRFENKLCPVCRERFRDGDDIVVCPECGTPHHRECYLKNKKCGVSELHAGGFVWNGRLPDEPKPAMPTAEEMQAILRENEKHSYVPEPLEIKNNNLDDDSDSEDENAGNIEEDNAREHSENGDNGEENKDDPIKIPGIPDLNDDMFEGMGMSDPVKELYKMVNDGKKGEDGVSMQELIAYTGTSVWHYSRAFRTFRGGEGGKKGFISFNICSGLFEPLFQFYRKMDIFGVILLIVSVLPSFLMITLTDSAAAAEAMAVRYSGVLSLINVVKTVLLCLFGDYLFYKQAVRRIRKMRRSFEGDTDSIEYLQALSEYGRPSAAHALLGFLGLMFVCACITAIGGGILG